MPTLTPQAFAEKWHASTLKERAAYQEHFIDLCHMLEQPTPAAADSSGSFYTFEKGVTKTSGGEGFADVWFREHFGWEYKGKHKDLDKAYDQLLLYREDIENPPLLIVCDFDRYRIHTNFTNCVKKIYEFTNEQLPQPDNLKILRALFTNPESLKPQKTVQAITEEVAAKFAFISRNLEKRGVEPHQAAHFLMKLLFCLFAEDVGLLKNRVFQRIIEASRKEDVFEKYMKELFQAMTHGGHAFLENIDHFNGGLFDDTEVLELDGADIETLCACAKLDWSAIEPAIFGTLFERSLDPSKRSQAGAHYTSKDDILSIVEPVLMQPLRREWGAVKAKALKVREKRNALNGLKYKKADKALRKLINDFLYKLSTIKVLDPACGSGNFLYVSLNLLLDLEKEVYTFAVQSHIEAPFRFVGPQQLYGIELNPYAVELAQLVVWIGYIQWDKNNGFVRHEVPILKPLKTIKEMDAILNLSVPTAPTEPKWPECDVIVSNPPFLGGSKLWKELGREYQHKLWKLYKDRVPGFADLCCYWFEKARAHIKAKKCKRAGLLATQGIRGGANREVLKRIKESGNIFFALSDQSWILEGASVRISLIGFDNGDEKNRILDGKLVETIHANLTTAANTTIARSLSENLNVTFIGTKKAGQFNVSEDQARKWLQSPNPHRQPNSDILRPWLNGSAIVKRPDTQWIIDCGVEMTDEQFSLYEELYCHTLKVIKPDREKNNRALYQDKWWLHAETRPGMRNALQPLNRFVATPRVSKFRLFVWADPIVLCDDGVFVFARSDDYFFGVLQSRLHEVWALKLGTHLGLTPRYTPTTCFETFPLPKPTPMQEKSIAQAAKELDDLRNNWLNPPEWTKEEVLEFPGSVTGPWARYVQKPNAKGIGTVKYPRLVPQDPECAGKLAERTLTNLYNQRPTWLDLAHKKLDAVVADAYGWPADLTDDEILDRLLKLNLERLVR
ncbi:MAG: DNA methyltransferase [Planctomycetota bacterium]